MPRRVSSFFSRSRAPLYSSSPRRGTAHRNPYLVPAACLALMLQQASVSRGQTTPQDAAPISSTPLAVGQADNTGNDQQSSTDPTQGENLSVSEAADSVADIASEGALDVTETSLEDSKKEGKLLTFRGAIAGIFDDNIFLSEDDKTSDVILLARLGVEIAPPNSGNGTFAFRYGATGFTYLDHSYLDAVNHAAILQAGLNLNKTKLTLLGGYSHISGGAEGVLGEFSGGGFGRPSAAEREGLQYVTRETAGVSAGLTHDLASKTVLTSLLNYQGNFYETGYNNSQDMQGRLGLGYKATGKTTIGLAGVYGYLDADSSPKETYQDALITAEYEATGKLRFKGDVGVEFRQLDGENQKDTSRVNFHFEGDYQMRDRTLLRLNAGSYTDGSAATSGRTIEHRFVAAGLDQTIGDKWKAGVSFGYELATYQSTLSDSIPDRDENYWYGRAGLTYAPNQRTSLGLFYEHRDNDGGGSGGLTYEGNQLGIQIALSF